MLIFLMMQFHANICCIFGFTSSFVYNDLCFTVLTIHVYCLFLQVHEGPLEFTKGYTITSTFKSKDSLPFVPPTSTSIQETQDIRKSLAIYDGRDAIVDAVQNNQILIVVGDAGFRKTSQIPQYLYET